MARRIVSFAVALTLTCACAKNEGAPTPAPTRDAAPDAQSGGWSEIFSELPGGLLSVGGTGPKDVWAVGSDEGSGRGALVLHYDGVGWERRLVGFDGDLWWVHAFEADVFLGGTRGAVLRFSNGTVERLVTPSDRGTVFGIWGMSSQDIWAVGGDTDLGRGPFVWRYDGTTWTAVVASAFEEVPVFFKVWGRSSEDVWLVGAEGALVHYDGRDFRRVDTGRLDPLFTVHGAGDREVVAVGGFDLGVALVNDGSKWAESALPSGVRQLFGVWGGADVTYAVGADATVLRREGGSWNRVDLGLPTLKPLHAVWGDTLGGIWAVGGDVLVPPLRAGVLLHSGEPIPTRVRDVDVPALGLDSGTDANPPLLTDAAPSDAALDVVLTDATARDVADAARDTGSVDGSAPDAHPDSDVTVPRVAGQIACGADSCDAATEQCCMDQTVAARPPVCVPAGETCADGFFAMGCDQGADCASGEVCCVIRFIQFGTIARVACQLDPDAGPACAIPMCADSDQCAAGACMASPWIPGYETCQ